jgi:uncharacterized membrane protein
MLKRENIWKTVTVLSIIGILLAVYLFYNYLTKPSFQPCYINSQINCDAVTKGSLSTMFGIPVSLIGLIGYIVILLSSLFRNKILLLTMSTFGLIFCLYITYNELFVVRVICPVCLTCQLVMLIIFLLGLKLSLGFKTK